MPDTTETQKDHRNTESYHRGMRYASVGFCASVVSESSYEMSCRALLINAHGSGLGGSEAIVRSLEP